MFSRLVFINFKIIISSSNTSKSQQCYSCDYFKDCQGGCMNEAIEQTEEGLYGKTLYCSIWKKLFKKIMKTQIETGMPYLFFKDTVNGMNPNKHDGMIGSGNLCQESFSNFSPTSYYKFSNLRYFFLKSHIYIGT